MMKTKNLFILCIFILANSSFASDSFSQYCKFGRHVQGVVADVYVGEVDEQVIGEACITYFKEKTKGKNGRRERLVGVVENIIDCSIADRFLDRIGRKVDTCLSKVQKFKNLAEIRALKAFFPNAFYLYNYSE